jgi:hypothetical protein
MTGNRAAPVRRPRRSNTLKDIQRLLGGAGTTYESRKDRLIDTPAKYAVHPTAGARTIHWRLCSMNLELQGTGHSVTENDLSLIDRWRPGKLLDMIDKHRPLQMRGRRA